MALNGVGSGLSDGGLQNLNLPYEKIVDDFEDGDISEYGGSTGSFATQTGTVYEGTYALYNTADKVSIASTSGLDNYPSLGDTLSVRVQTDSRSDSIDNVWFNAQSETDTPDGYAMRFDYNTNNWQINKWSGGGQNQLASTSVTYPTQSWLEGQMSVASNGDITATLLDSTGTQIASVSANDTAYGAGGIAFRVNSSSGSDKSYFDKAKLL